jgi:hypothetical protein
MWSWEKHKARKKQQKEQKKQQKEQEKRKADSPAPPAGEAPPVKSSAAVEPSPATGNAGPVAAEPETGIEMCQKLQEELCRPLILVKESRRDRTWHTAIKHQRAAYGVGMLGLVIATALTHGTAVVILTACSSSIPVLDFETFFDKKKYAYNKAVILDQAAIDELLNISAPDRADIAQAAIDAKGSVDGRATLTGADIEAAKAAITARRATLDANEKAAIAAMQATLDTDAGPGPVQTGVRMGLAVVGSGFLLLALTIIPEDIHTLATSVASLILVVGVLIIGGALANGSWLKARG